MHVNSGLTYLQCTDLKPYKKSVNHRFNQAMTPSHYLANLLHPVYRGKKLLSEHIDEADSLLLEQNPSLVPEFLQFRTSNLDIPKVPANETVIKKTDPVVW